eukprot:gene9298-16436_t
MVDPIASILESLPRIRTRVLDDTTILRRTPILTASMDTSAMVDPIAAILEALPRICTKCAPSAIPIPLLTPVKQDCTWT